jgi:hypothetical protein
VALQEEERILNVRQIAAYLSILKLSQSWRILYILILLHVVKKGCSARLRWTTIDMIT